MFNSSIYNDSLHQILNAAFTTLSSRYKLLLNSELQEKNLLEVFSQVFKTDRYNTDLFEIKYHSSFRFETPKPFSLIIFEKIGEMVTSKTGERYVYSEFFATAIKELPENYGNIYIRKENFNDKLIELFLKEEVDFEEYPEFSSKYYLLAEDKLKASKFLNKENTSLFVNNTDLNAEYFVYKNYFVIRNISLISEESIIQTVDFIHKI